MMPSGMMHQLRTYCEVTNLLIEGDRIVGVKYYNKIKEKSDLLYAPMVINATGPWAGALEQDLHLTEPIEMSPTMGTLLVIGKRLVNSLINRLRPPGDGRYYCSFPPISIIRYNFDCCAT